MTTSMIAEDGLILFQAHAQVPYADGLHCHPRLRQSWNPIVLMPYGMKTVQCAYCGNGDLRMDPWSGINVISCQNHQQPNVLAGVRRPPKITVTHITFVHEVLPHFWNGLRKHLGVHSLHKNVIQHEGSFYDISMPMSNALDYRAKIDELSKVGMMDESEIERMMELLMEPTKITEKIKIDIKDITC